MNISSEVARHINEIFLRHRQQVLEVEECSGACSAEIIAAGLKNLECMGYTLECSTIEKLRQSEESAVVEFFERTQCAVNSIVLNDPSKDSRLRYKPMYPGFPEQVMEADAAELFINALVHYMTDGKWMPDYAKEPYAANSGKQFVPVKLHILKTGFLEEFKELCCNLMNANTSISGSDAEDIKFFFENFDDAVDHIPQEMEFKENAAIIARICVASGRFTPEGFVEHFDTLIKTPTDVLRFAVVLSGGDAALAENCRFKSFSRKVRKTLLKLLDGKSSLLENMSGKREVWLRLGERLHPGEYPEFSRAVKAFKALRNGVKVSSFGGKVNLACECGLFDEAVKLLSQRPGDFARALDRVLRRSPDQEMVLKAFEAVAHRVSTRLLLEIRTHFQYRSNENFQPMSERLSPEEVMERRKMILKEKQEKVEKFIAEQRKVYDARIAAAEEKYEDSLQQLQVVEGRFAGRLSPDAISESTFDKGTMEEELQRKPLSDDALASAVRGLVTAMIENSFIAGTDENHSSLMKRYGIETPFERERRLAEKEVKRCLANVQKQKAWKNKLLDRLRKIRLNGRNKRPALDAESIRVFFPKGSLAKSYIVENDLTGIPEETCRKLVAVCEDALKKQYAEQESLGKVWVSEKLKGYLVPFSQRSASKSLRTIVRGSRLHFSEEVKVVRGFIWWKNAEENRRTDIDLSALLLDKNWKYVEHISFTNLRSPKTNSCHSGDIVDAPRGAAEYIDIDIDAAQKAGVRYVVFSVHGFTRHNFCDLSECSFGWMEREKAEGASIFDASGIGNKIDLAMRSRSGIPLFFDLQEKCAVWMDMTTESPLHNWNCLEINACNVLSVCRGVDSMRRPDLYDLAMLHAQARGELVENKEDADTVFDLEEGITPFDTDIWMAEYI